MNAIGQFHHVAICMLFLLRHHNHHVAIMELEFWSHTSRSLISGLSWVLMPFGV